MRFEPIIIVTTVQNSTACFATKKMQNSSSYQSKCTKRRILKDYIISTSRAWDKEKPLEFPTVFEPMIPRTQSGRSISTELRRDSWRAGPHTVLTLTSTRIQIHGKHYCTDISPRAREMLIITSFKFTRRA